MLEAAITAAIDDRSLRAAIDELLSLGAHLEAHGAADAAQTLVKLMHSLVTTLEVETLERGSPLLERAEARASAGLLLDTPRAERNTKLGEKAKRPWWSVRAETGPPDEEG